MRIQGYKAFNKGLKNRYGKQFKEQIVYLDEHQPKFGNDGYGYHFCKRLEDTLRYFPGMEEEIDIAQVTSIGTLAEYEDDYYGYYDMFATNIIQIDHVMTRKEIITLFLRLTDQRRIIRFIQGYKLTKEEIDLFRIRFLNDREIQNALSYYQEGIKDIYERPVIYEKKKIERL